MQEDQNSKIPKNNLRELRITPRISQWQLALTSGVKQSRISLIENRLIKPTQKEKEKLAAAINHKIEEIFPDNARDDRTNTDSNETN